MSSALITSRATKSTLPKPSESPSSMLLAPVHSSPEKRSELSCSRFPRPFLTTSMNCLWISSSIDCAWRFCLSSTGENGSRKALFSPEVRAPLDTEFLHGAGETPAVHDHADRPDDARLVHVDPVGGGRDVVAARSADVLDHGIHGNVGINAPQAADFVVDDSGLHRAAARRIDAQDHALRILVLERIL